MVLPLKKKGPPKDDFADLLGDAPDTGDTVNDEEEFEDTDSDDAGGFEDESDPMALGGDAEFSDTGIDPEVAGLCERLGFTDPDKQQALVDLVKLLAAKPEQDDMTGDLGADPMALGSSSGMGY